jgi:transcriptional regulator with XRE-family HTH domain
MVAVASKKHHEDDSLNTSKVRFVRRGPVGTGRVPLRFLREAAGLTQDGVGEKSGMAQGDVSKLEKAASLDDRTVATLRKYLAALGSELELAATFKLGHRFVLVGRGEEGGAPEPPPALLSNTDASEAIKIRAWATNGPFRHASEALSDAARMANATDGAGAEKAEVLRRLAFVTETVRKLAQNVIGELVGMGPTPRCDVELLDEIWKLSSRHLRRPRRSSSTLALREHPGTKADLVRDLRAAGFAGLHLHEWYGDAVSKKPPTYGAPPAGENRNVWLAEMGWLKGSIEKLASSVASSTGTSLGSNRLRT